MTQHVRWCSIENFYVRRRSIKETEGLLAAGSVVTYKAKVKLHGACAAIRLHPDGQVTAMSRETILSLGKGDSYGFAAWVAENPWGQLSHWKHDLVIFGEWAGPKIQTGVAINKLPERIFAIFAVLIRVEGQPDELVVEPSAIHKLLWGDREQGDAFPRTFILPWYFNEARLDEASAAWHANVAAAGLSPGKAADGLIEGFPTLYEALGMTKQEYVVWATTGEHPGQKFEIDWAQDAETMTPVVDAINIEVAAVEACDPWVKANFGIEGLGEGLVLYPVSRPGPVAFEQFNIKAKGEKHRVVAHTKPAQATAPTAGNLVAFASMVCTPARLEQAARAVANGELDFRVDLLGPFLKWLQTDISKETVAEMEAGGFKRKDALAACVELAKPWYRGRLQG